MVPRLFTSSASRPRTVTPNLYNNNEPCWGGSNQTMASTETIMPKIIQRPAVSQIEKRPLVDKPAPNDAPGVIKVMANSNVVPTNNDDSFVIEKEEKNDDPHNISMSTNSAAENTVNINGSKDDTYTSQVGAEAAAPTEEWNPLEEVDSALLTALCDSKERKALIRLENVLVDFMKDASLASIDVGGAFNSIVVGLVQQQSSSADETTTNTTSTTTSGNEEDATTFVSSHSLGLQDLQNQYSRGVRQTSFQRLILHRLADRFNIVREQINNVNPAAAASPAAVVANDRNTSERGLVDVGGNNSNYNNNMNNNNWSAPQQQQQMTYPLGLIRLIKTEESCIPVHLLNNLDLSLLVSYKNPRARNYAPNNNNINDNNNTNADEGMRTLSDNMNGASLDNNMSVMPGPKKPNKKMVIMKRNSSSNTSGSGDGLANGKRESRSRRKKLEDREKAYEEARARIFGKEAAAAEGVLEDQESDAAIQDNSAPPSNSCHSSFSVEDDGPLVRPGSADMDGSGHIVPSQLISGTTPNKARSASSSPEPQASNSQPASPREVEGGEQKQGQATSRTKAVYRNPQQEANDPDFRRRSAYVPAAPMGVVPNGCMPHGMQYNMVNPYAMNPYAAVSSGQHPHVMMQQQPPVFYPHPGHPAPQDPQSLQYPYSPQPRVFYAAQQPPQVQQVQKQPPQVQQVQIRPKEQQHVQQKSRPLEQKVQRAQSYEPKISDSTPPPPEKTVPRENDSKPTIKQPTWGPNAQAQAYEPRRIDSTNVAPPTSPEKNAPTENDSQPTIKQPTWGPNAQAQAYEPRTSNSTNVAPPPPPEKTVPRENDSQPTIKQPTWGPNAQLPKEVKSAAPIVPKASPAKKVAPPTKSNEKEEGEGNITMYKEEDFPALG